VPKPSDMTQQPTAFIAHGAGPLPLLGHPAQQDLAQWLSSYASTLPAPSPKAILVISGHWEVRANSTAFCSAKGDCSPHLQLSRRRNRL
jgi:aromatic ring-opening dioxygenase catalytic subunit (LigB family)